MASHIGWVKMSLFGSFVAKCKCGWHGSAQTSHTDAEFELRDHMEEVLADA